MKTNPTTVTYKGDAGTTYVVTIEATDKPCDWPDCLNKATHTIVAHREDGQVVQLKLRCDADAFSFLRILDKIEAYHDRAERA